MKGGADSGVEMPPATQLTSQYQSQTHSYGPAFFESPPQTSVPNELVFQVSLATSDADKTDMDDEDDEVVGRTNSTLEKTAQTTDHTSHIGDKDQRELARKRILQTFGFIVILSILLVFFVYEFVFKYLDPVANRRDYSVDNPVSSMPPPFIYLDFETDKDSDLECTLNVCTNIDCDPNHDQVAASVSTTGLNDWSADVISQLDTQMENYLDQTEWFILTNITQDAVESNTYQSLMVPPSGSDAEIAVNSKDEIVVELLCSSASGELIDDIYFAVDNKNQLAEFTLVSGAIESYHEGAEELRIEYEISFTYEWFAFQDKINGDDEPDYYVTSVGSTFSISNEHEELSDMNDGETFSGVRLRFSPNPAGRKTTFVTDLRVEIWDVFSATGGIYSIVGDSVFFLLSFILWGSVVEAQICKGVSPSTNPGETEERLSQQSKEEISVLNKKVVALAQEVLALRRVVKGATPQLKALKRASQSGLPASNTFRLSQMAYPDGNNPYATSPRNLTPQFSPNGASN